MKLNRKKKACDSWASHKKILYSFLIIVVLSCFISALQIISLSIHFPNEIKLSASLFKEDIFPLFCICICVFVLFNFNSFRLIPTERLFAEGKYDAILENSRQILKKYNYRSCNPNFDGLHGYWGNRAIYAALSAFALHQDDLFYEYLKAIDVPAWENYDALWIYIQKSVSNDSELNSYEPKNISFRRKNYLFLYRMVLRRNKGKLSETDKKRCMEAVSIPRLRNWLLQV